MAPKAEIRIKVGNGIGKEPKELIFMMRRVLNERAEVIRLGITNDRLFHGTLYSSSSKLQVTACNGAIPMPYLILAIFHTN